MGKARVTCHASVPGGTGFARRIAAMLFSRPFSSAPHTMVKSYDRYEQESVFGVICAHSNILWLPPAGSQSGKSLGRAAAAALEDILVWDIKTGEILSRLSDGVTPGASNATTSKSPPEIVVLAYTMQANLLASGHKDGSIKVWDMTLGSVLMTFSGHKSAVASLLFDMHGTRLVSGSCDSSIIMWDLVAEEGLFKLKGHKGEITGMQLLRSDLAAGTAGPDSDSDPDASEDYLVLTSKDGLLKVWDLRAKQCVETHLAHSGECWALGVEEALADANGGSGMMAVTCGPRDQVKVWLLRLAAPDGEKIQLRGDFEKLSKARCVLVGFTLLRDPSGTHVIFSLHNNDRTCEVFRVRGEDEIKKGMAKRSKRLKDKGMEPEEIVAELEAAEISMLITPLSTLRLQAKLRSCVWVPLKLHRQLQMLVALTNNSVEYWKIPLDDSARKSRDVVPVKTHTLDHMGHRTDIRAMDISDDDRMLATASNGELKVWNIKTQNVLRTFVLDSGYALCCKFLPGGTLVAVGFKNGNLELYDLASSSLIDSVEEAHATGEEGTSIWSMDMTPDGKTLITGGNDKKVKFWALTVTHEPVAGTTNTVTSLKLTHTQTLEVSDEVLCVRVSPNGKMLAVSLLNNNVQVVFLDTLKVFLTLYGHKLPVLSIDISFDNKLLITSSADKNIKIWGMDFGDCHKSIFGHEDSIMNVRFLPESHHFFSAGKDGMVKYWDGDKFQCIQKLPAHQAEVWSLAVSRSGSFVVSTSHDHSIRVWGATNDQVFLEEEREKEMDELYEGELLGSLENDQNAPAQDQAEDADADFDVTQVSKQNMETLKAGEKLMEALDIGVADLDANEAYEHQLQAHKAHKGAMPHKPTPNAILMAYGMSGHEYVLATLTKIRAAQLEDALLVLPFSYTKKLLRHIEVWTSTSHILANLVHLAVICKVLFFVMRVNAKELVAQRSEALRTHLINVKGQLRTELSRAAGQLGYNTQGLQFKRNQWRLIHESEFIDEAEQRAHEDQKAVKRTFATV